MDLNLAAKKFGIFFGRTSYTTWSVIILQSEKNGRAERNVKIIKDLILKSCNDINSKEFLDGLTQIRSSPRADGLSPCQVVFGRLIRTLIPTLTDALGINDCVEKARVRKTISDTKQKIYDRGSKGLQPLKEGMEVWVRNRKKKVGSHGENH